MRRIDELHLEFPFAGSRMLRGLLGAEGRYQSASAVLSPSLLAKTPPTPVVFAIVVFYLSSCPRSAALAGAAKCPESATDSTDSTSALSYLGAHFVHALRHQRLVNDGGRVEHLTCFVDLVGGNLELHSAHSIRIEPLHGHDVLVAEASVQPRRLQDRTGQLSVRHARERANGDESCDVCHFGLTDGA